MLWMIKNDENDGRRIFFVVGTFHKGVKKAEKSKLRKGREEFLWKGKDENDASVLKLKTMFPTFSSR